MEFQNQDFIQSVKRTREKFGVSIDEAHDMIFADEEMRRLGLPASSVELAVDTRMG